MRGDVRTEYEQNIDLSHHGRPEIIRQVHTGGRGRPSIWIDPDFLRWAYTLRTTSSIARFLNVNRQTVRNALLTYGIATPQANPFFDQSLAGGVDLEGLAPVDTGGPAGDDILDPQNSTHTQPHIISYTGPLSDINDSNLDTLIQALRHQFTRAGIAMLDGMLRNLGYRIPRERIRQSLIRIDPVHRVFERIRIRRRVYSVPGPNSLWHHDGQHGKSCYLFNFDSSKNLQGLIRWGIIIHGFIDGYSRLITGLQASDNNRGETVLILFHRAAAIYGVPSRIRGDHGVENILLAAWMKEHCGLRRGSYIWGR